MKKILIISGFLVAGIALLWVQSGCTPNGTPYNPHFNTTIIPTATPCGCYMMYANGSFVSIGNVYTWSGGGDSSPAGNSTDTSASCCGDSQSFQAVYTTLAGGGWSGLSVTPQTSPVNLSAFTTCTFYARANETATVGFNAAEPSADSASVAESLATSWAKFTITITDGSRTDGFANSSPPGTSISQTSNLFVEVITSTPATPVTVNFDQVSFQ